MSEAPQYPRVGVGTYVIKGDKVLFGRRRGGASDGTWCAPGGKLEMREDPLVCAARETKEECGLAVSNIRFFAYTNDVNEVSGAHFITLAYAADWASGEPALTEPDNFYEWGWFDWNELPQPLYLSARNLLNLGYNPINF